MTRTYRTDIDGLRAVAVVPVVLFHLGVGRASGGYVGVDVFFVISGFLITHALLAERSTWQQGLLDFYKRRIKRIFPALVVLYAGVMLLSFATLMSDQTQAIARSTLASTAFVSNILFYRQSGYFDGDLDGNPLLHTWSLSVEEQFYLFFPLVVFLTRNWSDQRRHRLIWGITAISFAASLWMVTRDASAAFYLIPFRTWELSLGSLLAIGAVKPPTQRWQVEAGVLLGLGVIAWSVFAFDSATVFPGASALLPCVGTALILLAGTERASVAGRLLSLSPVRFVGLISYSLYLWHWPIIVFYRQFDARIELADRILLLLLSLAAGTLSWAFVERPFRRHSRRPAKSVLLRGVAAMAACAAVAVGLATADSIWWPVSPQARRILAFEKTDGRSADMRAGTCFLASRNRFTDFSQRCLTASPDRPSVLIVGDSHGAHLYPGLRRALPGVDLLEATASGCKPVLAASGDARCVDLMHYVFSHELATIHPDVVILSARWGMSDLGPMEATIGAIRHVTPHVIVSGPIVEYDQPLPRILARHLASGDDVDRHRQNSIATVDRRFAAAARKTGTAYFSIYRAICPKRCIVWASRDVPLQFDYGHLTAQGSLVVGRRMAPLISAQLGTHINVAAGR